MLALFFFLNIKALAMDLHVVACLLVPFLDRTVNAIWATHPKKQPMEFVHVSKEFVFFVICITYIIQMIKVKKILYIYK